MKIALIAVSACLAAAILTVGLVTRSALTSDGHTINRQGQELSAVLGRLRQLQGRLGQLEGRLTTAQGSINGSHRDLITCADLQNLAFQLSGTDSAGGAITGVAGPAPISLPQHCINQ